MTSSAAENESPLVLHLHVLEPGPDLSHALDSNPQHQLVIGVRFSGGYSIAGSSDVDGDCSGGSTRRFEADQDLWTSQPATKMQTGHWAWDSQQIEVPPNSSAVQCSFGYCYSRSLQDLPHHLSDPIVVGTPAGAALAVTVEWVQIER